MKSHGLTGREKYQPIEKRRSGGILINSDLSDQDNSFIASILVKQSVVITGVQRGISLHFDTCFTAID